MQDNLLDDSNILMKLKSCAENAIEVLDNTRGAQNNRKACNLRQNLNLAKKSIDKNPRRICICIFASALEDVAAFAGNPKESFESKHLKKLGKGIESLLQSIDWKTKK